MEKERHRQSPLILPYVEIGAEPMRVVEAYTPAHEVCRSLGAILAELTTDVVALSC
jgi:hypothetical protein